MPSKAEQIKNTRRRVKEARAIAISFVDHDRAGCWPDRCMLGCRVEACAVEIAGALLRVDAAAQKRGEDLMGVAAGIELSLVAQGVKHWHDCPNNAATGGTFPEPCIRCALAAARAEGERIGSEKWAAQFALGEKVGAEREREACAMLAENRELQARAAYQSEIAPARSDALRAFANEAREIAAQIRARVQE